jgi:hypothetical protein
VAQDHVRPTHPAAEAQDWVVPEKRQYRLGRENIEPQARTVVYRLWIKMNFRRHDDGAVYETYLEELISDVLRVSNEETWRSVFCIKSEHWPAVKGVAKAGHEEVVSSA